MQKLPRTVNVKEHADASGKAKEASQVRISAPLRLSEKKEILRKQRTFTTRAFEAETRRKLSNVFAKYRYLHKIDFPWIQSSRWTAYRLSKSAGPYKLKIVRTAPVYGLDLFRL
jgi:hypothetical protein